LSCWRPTPGEEPPVSGWRSGTPLDTAGTVETNSAEFWVGYFDFPMIDNTRLTHDQRCAVVLNAFEDGRGRYHPVVFSRLIRQPQGEALLL